MDLFNSDNTKAFDKGRAITFDRGKKTSILTEFS